jgi:ABC-type lipoprotein release transport system permease subunit
VTAILTRARADLRAALGSSLALIVLLGVLGGAVMASAAGARRQQSAYPRFLAASGAPDAFVISAQEGIDSPFPVVDLAQVRRLPMVAVIGQGDLPFGVAEAPDGQFLWDASANIVLLDPKTKPRVLTGRLPDPGSLDEVAVGYRANQDPRVHLGATIAIDLVKAGANPFAFANAPPREDLLPPIAVRVVGTVIYPGEVGGTSADIFVTSALAQRYFHEAQTFPGMAVTLKHGLSDFPAFAKAVDAIAPGAVVFSQEDEVKSVRRSTQLQSIALWLFGILAALAGGLIFAQSVTRQTVLGGTDNPTLRALGMTPSQLIGVAMVRALLVGLGGALVAIVFAVALSPLTPLGLARLVEPSPGISFDWLILGLGASILVVLVPLLAAFPSWRSARTRADALGTATPTRVKPSVVADALAGAGFPPTVVTGVRLALEPGRGRSAVPVRSTVLGITLAIAAFAASFAFLGSYRHLLVTPRLYGVDFDIGAGNPFLGSDTAPDIVRVVRADPDVSEFSGGNILDFVQVTGSGGSTRRVNIWAFDPIQGSVHPTVTEGRWPGSDREIVLGSRSMRAIHTGVGDTVTVEAGSLRLTMKVVGRGVFPEGGFGPGLGDGGGLTYQGLRRFFPDAPENAFPIRLTPGASAAAASKRLNQELQPFGASIADLKDTPNLSNFKRIESLPLLLAGLLALAGAATMMHTLVSSIRRRRRDLAILKTLGFLRGQVSAAVAWQATTLVIVALLLGIPLGIAAGRWGWNVFADELGIVPEPKVSLLPLLVTIPATLVLANLIALLPGRAASRVSPAVVLRSE